LEEHWEVFIRNQVVSGRYGSASEVVQDALRYMEERNSKLTALRAHLAQGETQARQGDFVHDYSIVYRKRRNISDHPCCIRFNTIWFAAN